MFIEKLNQVLTEKKPYITDPLNLVSLGLALAVNLANWLVLYVKIKPGKIGVVLHYSVVYGSNLIGKSTYLYWIPGLALILLAVNSVIAFQFYKKEKFAGYFLNFSSIAIQVIFFAGTLALIAINE